MVRRRYNDFIWLRQKLVDTYPTHIIPVSWWFWLKDTLFFFFFIHFFIFYNNIEPQPLPGKHTLLAQLDRYSKEFIMARMKLLHAFLNRVVNHPILSYDKSLCIFLTAKPAVRFYIIKLTEISSMFRIWKVKKNDPYFYSWLGIFDSS